MSQTNQPFEPPKQPQTGLNLSLLSVGGQVGCAILVLILVALAVGIGLDKLLGTKYVFTIVLFLGSFPVSLYLTYKLAMRSVKSINPEQPADTQPKLVEEEDKRE